MHLFVPISVKTMTTIISFKRKIGKIYTCQKVDMATTRIHGHSHSIYIDSLSISAVNDMSITNARLPFWRVVGTKESRYGAIAKLYSICMLDVSMGVGDTATMLNIRDIIDKRENGRCTQRSISDTVAYAVYLVCTMERVIRFHSACGK